MYILKYCIVISWGDLFIFILYLFLNIFFFENVAYEMQFQYKKAVQG